MGLVERLLAAEAAAMGTDMWLRLVTALGCLALLALSVAATISPRLSTPLHIRAACLGFSCWLLWAMLNYWRLTGERTPGLSLAGGWRFLQLCLTLAATLLCCGQGMCALPPRIIRNFHIIRNLETMHD